MVDTLPLLNRWLHHVRLRFYGHGPEAVVKGCFVELDHLLGDLFVVDHDASFFVANA